MLADSLILKKDSVFSVLRGILAVTEEGHNMFASKRVWTMVVGLCAAGPGSLAAGQSLVYANATREISCATSVPDSGDAWSTTGMEDVDQSLSCGDASVSGSGSQVSRLRSCVIDLSLGAAGAAAVDASAAGFSRALFDLTLATQTTVHLAGRVHYRADAGSVLSSASVRLTDAGGASVEAWSVASGALEAGEDTVAFSIERTLAAGDYALDVTALVSYQGLSPGDAESACDLRLTVLSSQCCPGDTNDDGLLDFFDLSTYLNWYASGDLRADYVADELLDFFDLQAYLNAYAAGCP